MHANWKPALAAIAGALLLAGCPIKVKDLVGTAKVVTQDRGDAPGAPKALSPGHSLAEWNPDTEQTLELCEGSSITLDQKQGPNLFAPTASTTLVGPGIWRLRSDGWMDTGRDPECDDDDDRDRDDDNDSDNDNDDNDRDDEQDREQEQERHQEQRQQSDTGSQGGNSGNVTPGRGGNTFLGVGTSTAVTVGGLIGAVILVNELDDGVSDEPISE